MKKLVTLMIAGMMAFSMVACGSDKTTDTQEPTSVESSDDVFTDDTSADDVFTDDTSTDDVSTDDTSTDEGSSEEASK